MDWDLIKAKPDKEHKVIGTQLLELKAKLDQDHAEIDELKAQVEKLTIERDTNDEKSSNLDGKVNDLENT